MYRTLFYKVEHIIWRLKMSTHLPNFTLELNGDMKTNWDYFKETFDFYVTLMGYCGEKSEKS